MISFVTLICPVCQIEFKKREAYYKVSLRRNAPSYCGKPCFHIARRHNKTEEQKKAEKSEYDRLYREKNLDKITEEKRQFFKKDYAENPEKYRQYRKKRMKKHVEYCRRPEYRAYKHTYDQQYQAVKNYGEFAEAALLLRKIESEIDNRLVKQEQGLINKSQKRKRRWKN